MRRRRCVVLGVIRREPIMSAIAFTIHRALTIEGENAVHEHARTLRRVIALCTLALPTLETGRASSRAFLTIMKKPGVETAPLDRFLAQASRVADDASAASRSG